jgi:predicted GNAT family N-acyltransferase
MSTHDIRPITAAETRPLRHAILRPHQPPEALVYQGDDAPQTFHAGAFHEGRLVGIASVTPNPCPRAELPAPWQLRGMATVAELRGQGYGRAMILRCIEHIVANDGATLWCNGRVTAEGFYTGLGFQVISEEFVTDTGPHYVFTRALRPS